MSQNPTQSKTTPVENKLIIIGEVLFDVFPDGTQVLGGAPFNVAWHLHGFALPTLFVSRLGEDQASEIIKEKMISWGMDLTGIQFDPKHPTGQVNIHWTETSHSFDILDQQAYDFIDDKALNKLLHDQNSTFLYHGSLAMRNPVSRSTIVQAGQKATTRFVDINLRSPWWNLNLVKQAITACDYLKLNDEELDQLFPDHRHPSIEERLSTLVHDLSLHLLILTCGAKGAYLCTKNEVFFEAAPTIDHLVDTVGAGDAFSAVCIYGLLNHWSKQEILKRALAFAATICEQQGAIRLDHAFYMETQSSWT
ncbi:MAG: carbohydrate kinase [Gammaproteobacteria bacterium]|nr:carbohydrate kinase [Gammaproteobacteria bacterium]